MSDEEFTEDELLARAAEEELYSLLTEFEKELLVPSGDVTEPNMPVAFYFGQWISILN